MKIKVANATNLQLDWLVAKAEGWDVYIPAFADTPWLQIRTLVGIRKCPNYSADWAQGGPIGAREGIAARRHSSGKWFAIKSTDLGDGTGALWQETTVRGGTRYGPMCHQVHKRQQRFDGPTELVAKMRCYVASTLGDEVEIPEELK